MHGRNGGGRSAKDKEKDFCTGVVAKDVLAAGKGLASAGWTCSAAACGATGNFPHRRLCRACGKATVPAAWATAQQRAVAQKAAGAADHPWSPKKGRAAAEASEGKQLQELRKELARAQRENQLLKAAGSQGHDAGSATQAKADESDGDPAEDALSKQVAHLQRIYDQCVAAKDADLAPTIKAKLEKAQQEWRATWSPDRVRTRHERRLESAKDKLAKSEAAAEEAGQQVEACERELAQAKLAKAAAQAKLAAAREEATKIEQELADAKTTEEAQGVQPGKSGAGKLIAMLEQTVQQDPEQAKRIAATLKAKLRGAAAARAGAVDTVMLDEEDEGKEAAVAPSLELTEQQQRSAEQAEQAEELAALRAQMAAIRGLDLAAGDGDCATKLQALADVMERGDDAKRQKKV